MKKLFMTLAIAIAIFIYIEKETNIEYNPHHNSYNSQDNIEPNTQDNNKIINAFKNNQSNIQVGGSGIVLRNLPDDTRGSRHQKFILKLSSDQTLLIAHNIDLAPRIDSLSRGDSVEFYGEYEWSSKGGTVHWTHHDPNGHHKGGWLKHDGVIYQ